MAEPLPPADREAIEINKRHWNEIVGVNVRSRFYDVEGFKAGEPRLHAIERGEIGDVRGKSLLHLQCHFGMDTIAWARDAGAVATGADFSEPAVATARALAREMGVDARFVCADLYDLPEALAGEFDVVFTSYGVLGWLPDLRRWAEVVAHFVRPGGTFYIVEFHPFAWVFDDAPGADDLRVKYPYFRDRGAIPLDSGSYADPSAPVVNTRTINFPYELGEVVTSLVRAGLAIEHLHEFPFSVYPVLPCTELRADGEVVLARHDGCVPLLFSIKATKPGGGGPGR